MLVENEMFFYSLTYLYIAKITHFKSQQQQQKPINVILI